MKRQFIKSVFIASFLIASLYGLSLILPLYFNSIEGSEVDLANFLFTSGLMTIFIVILVPYLLHILSPWILSAIGTFVFGLGIYFLSFFYEMNLWIYLSSFLIGIGWGLFYVGAPIGLSRNLNNKNRAFYFTYFSAIISVGVGLLPSLSDYMITHGLDIHSIFKYSFALTILATMLFVYANKIEPLKNNKISVEKFNFKPTIGYVISSEVKYPIIMVFLGACLLSFLTYFQVNIALENHVDYTVFFITFTLSMIGSRILLGGFVAKLNEQYAIVALAIILLISSISFLFIKDQEFIYVLASLLFGVGYGLIYPLIKTLVVNLSDEKFHSSLLTLFSLAYFVGLLGYPKIISFLLKYCTYQDAMYSNVVIAMLYVLSTLLLMKKPRS